MDNRTFFDNRRDFAYAYETYRKLTREAGLPESSIYDADPVGYVYKSADTALQRDLAVGTLVQIPVKQDLSRDMFDYRYAVVTGYDFHGCNGQEHYDTIMVRFAGSNSPVSVKVETKVLPASYSRPPKLYDIKIADIPADVLKLTACPDLSKCPLKHEGICMEDDDE